MLRSPIARLTESVQRGLITPRILGFGPIALFAGAANGAWYDPSDIATLYQDNAFGSPVTTFGQAVGGILDKSGNARHLVQAAASQRPTYAGTTISDTGGDLVSNGTFASDTVWAKGAGWTISGGVGVATAASTGISQTVAVVGATLYRLTFTVAGYTGGTLTPRFTGGTTVAGAAVSANGTYTIYLRAETGNTTLSFLGAALTCTIDNVALVAQAHSGLPCLRFDGVAQNLAESGTHTLQLPTYVAACYAKVAQDALGFFGSILDATNHHALLNVATNSRASGGLQSTARGASAATVGNNEWPIATAAAIDSLAIVGTTDVQVNAGAAATAANAWTAPDTVAAAKLRISGLAGAAASPGRFYGGVILIGTNPGAANRLALRRWLAAKAGLTF